MLKIDEYKELIKEHKFFEAHEVFEEFWFPRRFKKDDYTLIVKGFINAAVAFELKKRGREESSKRVWRTYLKHSKKVKNKQEFIELKYFIDNFAKKWLFID